MITTIAQAAPAAETTARVLDTTPAHWTHFSLAVLAAYAAGKLAGAVFLAFARRADRRERPASAAILRATSRTMGFFSIALGLYIGSRFVEISGNFAPTIDTAFRLLFTAVGGLFAWRMAEVATQAFARHAAKTEGKMDDMLVPILRTTLRVVVLVLLVVQVVQVVSHEQVSSLIAGLGIGGLAVALAAQDSIKNVFGSVVIIADKPFTIDERIQVDGIDGIVEEVGLRSTRIRTFDGSLVTIPNGQMADKTIVNVGRRRSIRRLLNVTLTYDTTPDKVARAKQIVGEILAVPPMQGGRTESGSVTDPATPPRVHFSEFNDSSLNVQVIYWYASPNWWDYMAYTEWFNFQLLRRLNDEGIDMAFPTQTIYLAGDAKRPLDVAASVRSKGLS
jgi:MscS family membrane protein